MRPRPSDDQVLLITCDTKQVLQKLLPGARIQKHKPDQLADVAIRLAAFPGSDTYAIRVRRAHLEKSSTFWWLYFPYGNGLAIWLRKSVPAGLFRPIRASLSVDGVSLDGESRDYHNAAEVTEQLGQLAKGGWRGDWPTDYAQRAVDFIDRMFDCYDGRSYYHWNSFRPRLLEEALRKKLQILRNGFSQLSPPSQPRAEVKRYELRSKKRCYNGQEDEEPVARSVKSPRRV